MGIKERWARLFPREQPFSTDIPTVEGFGELFVDLACGLHAQSSLEVGAHAAEFSIAMGKAVPGIPAIALEANPAVFGVFKPKVPVEVEYLNLAAAAESGSVTMNVVREVDTDGGRLRVGAMNTFSSILKRRADARYEAVTVPATTIDELVAARGLKDIALWVDVEGANREVLAGAKQSLASAVRCALIEVEERTFWAGQWLRSDVDRFMRELGFLVHAQDAPDGSPQYNVIYVKP